METDEEVALSPDDSAPAALRRTRMNWAGSLRRELSQRAEHYARSHGLPHCLSYGRSPTVCFESYGDSHHGNFLPFTYRAILRNPNWRRRLQKVHSLSRKSLPRYENGVRRELDACTSSDALLMNVFCYPGVLKDGRLSSMLDGTPGTIPNFGFRARVPLATGKFDRTEVDMRLGDLLIEDWYAVMKCVHPVGLRLRCKVLTWQELAKALPTRLGTFLREKYGINDALP